MKHKIQRKKLSHGGTNAPEKQNEAATAVGSGDLLGVRCLDFDFRELRVGMGKGSMCKELTTIVHLFSDHEFETALAIFRASRVLGKAQDKSTRLVFKDRNCFVDQFLLRVLVCFVFVFTFSLAFFFGKVSNFFALIQKRLNVVANMFGKVPRIYD